MKVISGFALSLALVATPVFAQNAPAAGQPAAAAEDPDMDKIICQSDKAIGSRVKTAKRCQTKRQWEAEKQANRQLVDRVQAQRTKAN